jgi:NAD kinase
MAIEKATIVKSKTRLEFLIERFNTRAQAQFYIEHSGGNFTDYEAEDGTYHDSLDTICQQVSRLIKTKIIDRSFIPNNLFSENEVIIVVGQDGLVANTAKYVGKIPIIAVNPDVSRYDGILLPFNVKNYQGALEQVLTGTFSSKYVTRAEARLHDGQRLLAFNDLFIGPTTHLSARYRISFAGTSENHSSSGIIVSTGAGSTGWLSSLFNMARGIVQTFEGKTELQRRTFSWAADELVFIVREPFQSKTSQIGIIGGIINPQTILRLESFMPNYGVIFSDGIESDFLRFNSGAIAEIGIAKEKARLVVG